MSAEAALLDEIRGLGAKLDQLLMNPKVRVQPYTSKEAATLLCRSQEWVSDQCRLRRIKALPGTPYRIPVDEMARLLKLEN